MHHTVYIAESLNLILGSAIKPQIYMFYKGVSHFALIHAGYIRACDLNY